MRGVPESLHELLRSGVEGLALELVGIEFHSAGRHSLLRIYIDREGGVDVEDCATVSRRIGALLDVEDPIPGRYTLEVSSPGLDRPLFSESDFERYVGHQIKLRTSVTVDGRKRFKGVIESVVDGQVVMQVDGESVVIQFGTIQDARLVPVI
jgi:ribosome maturation factor RimP